ncbi:phytoene/squalene synthase family protein [Cytobacillus purgationiresistens]|uniref:Farnesyl-diphosphate farnesyltransferase n=1 Tax=Cytobacillus purgationiresistens TaxID=863449 RepID=A0ABU0AQY4_9BACI|nr:phytoene/squalene synthase family protein [Cytobacillus purgationiresistens]MDQ0273623.1 farnesyl-diphosphate farnesyltransferase [Cytobacillus purgationiresistens]
MSERNNVHEVHNDAIDILKETSRTFFIPISLLSPGLKESVASAYLCMRAIDEIEDHPQLEPQVKRNLLYSTSEILKTKPFDGQALHTIYAPYQQSLPEVTLRLSDWISYCPEEIRNEVLNSTSIMAEGMGDWVKKDWNIKTEEDLDQYTYTVAGLVGVMLTDIWKWYDQTKANKDLGIGFGRGLQAVNILRNYKEDEERGVSFFPEGWTLDDMFEYARRNLDLADRYVKDLKTDTIVNFCQIPLALAHGTMKALTDGREKMTRNEVNDMVSKVITKTS